MKKLLALLLALMMVFTLAACGNEESKTSESTDNSITSQNDNSDSSGGNNETLGKEWPADKYNWTGNGKIVDVTDNSADGKTNFQAYIDTATLDEFTAYVASLKSAGFAFTQTANADEEPAEGYDENDYRYLWNGENADGWTVSITLNKSEQQGVTDSLDVYKYYLEIAFRSK